MPSIDPRPDAALSSGETARESTRESLLRAARAELADGGHADISLRAVARRAGVSHAAPKHHFLDRRGLLTAVAARGFDELTASLDDVADLDRPDPLTALGVAYIDFGLAHPALFELMFRPTELDADDPALHAARLRSVATLLALTTPESAADPGGVPAATLPETTDMAWALVHGLVVLCREGVLSGPTRAHQVVAAFSRLVAGRDRT